MILAMFPWKKSLAVLMAMCFFSAGGRVVVENITTLLAVGAVEAPSAKREGNLSVELRRSHSW